MQSYFETIYIVESPHETKRYLRLESEVSRIKFHYFLPTIIDQANMTVYTLNQPLKVTEEHVFIYVKEGRLYFFF